MLQAAVQRASRGAVLRLPRYAAGARLFSTVSPRQNEEPGIGATVKNELKQSFEEKHLKDVVAPATSPSRAKQKKTLELFTLEKKVAVITGGARGLGNTFARAFLESGCSGLAILDLNQKDADRAAEELRTMFGKDLDQDTFVDVKGFACDVSNEDSVKIVLQEVVDEWGTIDVLVASAGIVENFPAMEYPTSKIRKLFDVNVHGAFFSAREAARHMIKNRTRGSIVLVSSMSANVVNIPQPQAPYNASKAAVKHMAASLAVEWAQYGIRVNALSPGYMLTALTKAILDKDEELKAKWIGLTPMGRLGDPEDLNGAVVYLASEASRFTTGTEIRVDGGYTVVGLDPESLPSATMSLATRIAPTQAPKTSKKRRRDKSPSQKQDSEKKRRRDDGENEEFLAFAAEADGRTEITPSSKKLTPWSRWVRWDDCHDVATMLHYEVLAFVDYISASPEEHEFRRLVVEQIRRAILAVLPRATVTPFGSYGTNLYLPTGDIDLVVTEPDVESVVPVLRKFAKALVQMRVAKPSSVTVVSKARVPIVKFTTIYGEFLVDISVNQTGGISAANLVNKFLDKFSGLRHIVMAVKAFLSQRDLNEVYSGGLGSYSIFCMVTSFFQMHPKIRNGEINPGENLGVLLIEFFELYGFYFNYSEVGISLRDGGMYYRKDDRGWTRQNQTYLLSIEDPQLESNDVSGGTHGINKIKRSFVGAFELLTDALQQRYSEMSAKKKGRYARLRESEDPKSLLGSIISVSMETIKKRRTVHDLYMSKTLHDILGEKFQKLPSIDDVGKAEEPVPDAGDKARSSAKRDRKSNRKQSRAEDDSQSRRKRQKSEVIPLEFTSDDESSEAGSKLGKGSGKRVPSGTIGEEGEIQLVENSGGSLNMVNKKTRDGSSARTVHRGDRKAYWQAKTGPSDDNHDPDGVAAMVEMSLSERIAAFNRNASTGTSPQHGPHSNSPSLPRQSGPSVKDKAARFDGLGPAPAPKGSFGLGAPMATGQKSNRELWGNRIPSVNKGNTAGYDGGRASRPGPSSSGVASRSPSRSRKSSLESPDDRVPADRAEDHGLPTPLTEAAVESLGAAVRVDPSGGAFQSAAPSVVGREHDATSSIAVEADDTTRMTDVAVPSGVPSPSLSNSTVSDSVLRAAPPILSLGGPAFQINVSSDESSYNLQSNVATEASSSVNTLSTNTSISQIVPPVGDDDDDEMADDVEALQISDSSDALVDRSVKPLPLSSHLLKSLQSTGMSATPSSTGADTPKSMMVESGSVDGRAKLEDLPDSLSEIDADDESVPADETTTDVDLSSDKGDDIELDVQPELRLQSPVLPLSSTHLRSLNTQASLTASVGSGMETPRSMAVEDGSDGRRSPIEANDEEVVDSDYFTAEGTDEATTPAGVVIELPSKERRGTYSPALESPAVLAYAQGDSSAGATDPPDWAGGHSPRLLAVPGSASEGVDMSTPVAAHFLLPELQMTPQTEVPGPIRVSPTEHAEKGKEVSAIDTGLKATSPASAESATPSETDNQTVSGEKKTPIGSPDTARYYLHKPLPPPPPSEPISPSPRSFPFPPTRAVNRTPSPTPRPVSMEPTTKPTVRSPEVILVNPPPRKSSIEVPAASKTRPHSSYDPPPESVKNDLRRVTSTDAATATRRKKPQLIPGVWIGDDDVRDEEDEPGGGAFFGAILAAFASFHFGRRTALLIGCIFFAAGGVTQTTSNGTVAQLYVGRLLAGFGIGSVSQVCPIYVGECASKQHRSRAVAAFQLCLVTGGMLAYWIGYAVSVHISPTVSGQWQIPIGIQLIPGAIFTIGLLFVPESPRFLAYQQVREERKRNRNGTPLANRLPPELADSKKPEIFSQDEIAPASTDAVPPAFDVPHLEKGSADLTEDMEPCHVPLFNTIVSYTFPWFFPKHKTPDGLLAISTLAYLRDLPLSSPVLRAEMAEIFAQIDEIELDRQMGKGSWKELLRSPSNRRRLVVAAFVGAWQIWVAQTAILYYAPTIFQSIGFSSSSTSLLASGAFTCLKVLSTIVALVVTVDRYGRVSGMTIGGLLQGTLFCLIGIILATHPVQKNNPSPSAASLAMMALIYAYVLVYSFTIGPLPWLYASEIFPLHLRDAGQLVFILMTWSNNFAVAKLTPIGFAEIGIDIIFGAVSEQDRAIHVETILRKEQPQP
ncbi:hypothetical protein FRB99_005881 [Tulasnella sp. 403]|nr:hypothetical protein FRB99_005881 [Tulasnella sp. 403]